MSDLLKLSDSKGDAAVENIAHKLFIDDAVKRIQELERNNAALEKVLAEQKTLAKPATAGNNKIGARKNANFKAVSTAPSINKTPRGSAMVPVAYPTVQDLSSSAGVSSNVRFNGDLVYLLDSSSQPHCKGDEQGTGGGVRSGTVNGEVKPVQGSSSVKVNGKPVVRQGDACTMNGGNNPGIYTTTQAPSAVSPRDAIATSNPVPTLDTPEEESAFKKWLAKSWDEMKQAYRDPKEGGKGAAKGIGNIPSDLGELFRAGSAEQLASRLDETAQMLDAFGLNDAAKAHSDSAGDTRGNAANLGLPKFTLNNPAQEGGNKILIVVQIFVGVVGVFKGLPKWLKPTRSSGNTAEITLSLEAKTFDGVKIATHVAESKTDALATFRTTYAKEIDDFSTFETVGFKGAKAEEFLATTNGENFLKELSAADPSASASTIYNRAIEQLGSGVQAPALEKRASELVKIVPQGQKVSSFSPYFTTRDQLAIAKTSGQSLADYFGLPLKSEAAVYDIYQIKPKTKNATVLISNVAPTSELDGLVLRPGGAVQYILPNRADWTQPVHIGIIEN